MISGQLHSAGESSPTDLPREPSSDVYSTSYAGIRNSSRSRTGDPDGRAPAQAIPGARWVPILIHSLRAFAAVERVTAIYVAVRNPRWSAFEAQIAEYGFADRVHVVEGGDNRQESVAHALAALPAEPDDIVLVHDAVRPLIDVATIDRTIDAVAEFGAAIVGMPAVDTIKQVERTAHGALITSTIPREYVVLAQTPQGFRYGLLQARLCRGHGGWLCRYRRSFSCGASWKSGRRSSRFSG